MRGSKMNAWSHLKHVVPRQRFVWENETVVVAGRATGCQPTVDRLYVLAVVRVELQVTYFRRVQVLLILHNNIK